MTEKTIEERITALDHRIDKLLRRVAELQARIDAALPNRKPIPNIPPMDIYEMW